MNKNLTYEDYLLKSVDSTAVELLSDSDLVGLHITITKDSDRFNNLAKSNADRLLPLLEKELLFRKDALLKAKEEDDSDDEEDDDSLEKGGKPALAGEIREWNGRRYKKQSNGKWLEVSESHGFTKKEHKTLEEKHIKLSGDSAQLNNDSQLRFHKETADKHRDNSKNLSDKEHDDSEVGLGKKNQNNKSPIDSFQKRIILSELSNLHLDIEIPEDLDKDGGWSKTQKIVKDKNLGIFSGIMKDVEIKANFAKYKDNIVLNLIYNYNHHNGGSNGNSVAMIFNKDGDISYKSGYLPKSEED